MTSFSGSVTTQFPWPVPFPRQRKAALESCVRFATTFSRLNQARNKYYGGITKRMNFVETSESIEPNDNNLKLRVNAIGYIFSKIF